MRWLHENEFELAIAYNLQGNEIARKPVTIKDPVRAVDAARSWAMGQGNSIMDSGFYVLMRRRSGDYYMIMRKALGRQWGGVTIYEVQDFLEHGNLPLY